jgi:hypothetical protein
VILSIQIIPHLSVGHWCGALPARPIAWCVRGVGSGSRGQDGPRATGAQQSAGQHLALTNISTPRALAPAHSARICKRLRSSEIDSKESFPQLLYYYSTYPAILFYCIPEVLGVEQVLLPGWGGPPRLCVTGKYFSPCNSSPSLYKKMLNYFVIYSF